jgi:hypothetical protein
MDRAFQKDVLDELSNFFNCKTNKSTQTLKENDELYVNLQEEFKHSQINLSHITVLINLLSNKIIQLRTDNIENLPVDEVGQIQRMPHI